ncbi:hypothetical protein GBFDFA_06095 [Edwardsiella anguillarum]|nr:hypothetical protein PBOPBF_06100 [Edwardsiella anguillarum]BET83701.1 hypothetical protein GHNJMD_06405 [Edwardsiella anguillarum]BET87068.1 hypothetical protein GBFDFA_06095 [Edwardsiella anguillarum]BET90494.1 hypothetical protein BIKEJJ_06100 [Edwardsiella anguillarum]
MMGMLFTYCCQKQMHLEYQNLTSWVFMLSFMN